MFFRLTTLLAALASAGQSSVAAAARQHDQGQAEPVHFAIIGDFGDDSVEQAMVANLVNNTFRPDFIISVGDNNYLPLSLDSYDLVVGKYFHQYIGEYRGRFGRGAAQNRFWPAIGNHDWSPETGYQPYLDYFTLPGHERYYDVVLGPIHFFFANSDVHEPDGRARNSVQALWLERSLRASTSAWKFVVLHHAPFSSSTLHGSNPFLQWPFKHWGAHVVLAGHDHTYERLDVGGIPYFISGLGGKSIYPLGAALPQTRARDNDDFGAMCVWVDATTAVFQSYSIADGMTLLDSFTFTRAAIMTDLVSPAATWKYLDDGSDPGSAWRAVDFDDIAWKDGQTQFGYGEGDETTTVSFGSDPANRFVTTYFRHSFEFDPVQRKSISGLRLALLRDDGAVAYLNGIEVFRSNMPAGEIHHRTLAAESLSGHAERVFHERVLDPCLLRQGANVLAVEIHKAAINSTDLSFDLMLTPVPGTACRGDLGGDHAAGGKAIDAMDRRVDVHDLLVVLNALGPCRGEQRTCAADLASADGDCGDGFVDALDLLALIHAWGECPQSSKETAGR